MKLEKVRVTAIILAIAMIISLSGTFAWQSIGQMARSEATEPTNPGGRLHDDFSGYEADDTKDVYVENFGNQPIYARVRLDEYMEIGEGAGRKGTVGEDGTVTPDPENKATPLVTGAKLNDVSTWTTHIPGATADAGTETNFADPSKTFHTYWTWTMGGQAEDNPDGNTVYMPTFNKNKDSLQADVNGTLAGLDKDPEAGDQYDDYVKYTVGTTASRVRDNDATHPNGSTYDIDADTVDECGPYGGAGGSGVEGVNYGVKAETHAAQETMNASVITMAEYKTKSDADKAEFLGWVYDVDGWAYWSQAIEPGTPTETNAYVTNATGVLLDRIEMKRKPSDTWYYSINAVGQFITADDLGRTDDPKTGFYANGETPTDDALDLLDGIGVNTAGVKGSVTTTASVTVEGEVKTLNYAVQGMHIDLTAVVTVAGVDSPSQDVTWKLTGATDPATQIVTVDGKTVLKVGPNETAGGTLTITASSTNPEFDRLKGKLKLPVQPLTYIVTVTPDDGATSVLPGGSQSFTALFTTNDFRTDLPQTFTWTVDPACADGTAVTANEDDSSKAILTVAGNETGAVTVKATPTNTAAYPGVSGTATIPVTAVTYAVDIQNSEGNSVKDATVTIKDGQSATFTLDVTSTPEGAAPTDNWTWSSDNEEGGITVDNNGKVSVAIGTATGTTATITAQNSDYTPALEAGFTVTAQKVTYAVAVTPKTATVYPSKTQDFTATVTVDDGSTPDQTVTWSVSGNTDPNTKFSGNTLTVGADETWGGTLTVTATYASGASDTATVTVATPTFTLEIQDSSTSTKVTAVELPANSAKNYKVVATPTGSTPSDLVPGGTWSWTSSDTSRKITVSSTGAVSVASGTAVGTTATITATNSKDGTLTASFTVKVRGPSPAEVPEGGTAMVDDEEFIVLVKNAKITGTDGVQHNAALLLSKNVYGDDTSFGGSDNMWKNSSIKSTLNGSYLTSHATIKSKAIEVSIQTRSACNQTTSDGGVDCKVFLLSEADVFGTSNFGRDKRPQSWEFTYGGKQLPCFKYNTVSNIATTKSSETPVSWWLRSPADTNAYAAVVDSDGTVFRIFFYMYSYLRPAFWYNLDS